MIDVKVKLLTPTAILPTKATPGSAGWDLYAAQSTSEFGWSLVGAGIALEIPPGYEGQIRGRSGLALKGFVVHPGTIDSDYREEVAVICFRPEHMGRIRRGDRIAQLVICPVPEVRLLEVGKESVQHRYKPFGSSMLRCFACGQTSDRKLLSEEEKDALWEEPCFVSDLSPTTRNGGFGSSGR